MQAVPFSSSLPSYWPMQEICLPAHCFKLYGGKKSLRMFERRYVRALVLVLQQGFFAVSWCAWQRVSKQFRQAKC